MTIKYKWMSTLVRMFGFVFLTFLSHFYLMTVYKAVTFMLTSVGYFDLCVQKSKSVVAHIHNGLVSLRPRFTEVPRGSN